MFPEGCYFLKCDNSESKDSLKYFFLRVLFVDFARRIQFGEKGVIDDFASLHLHWWKVDISISGKR